MGAGEQLVLLLVCLLAGAAAIEGETDLEEPRGKLKKAILPMLVGVVLKASTLVPMSLMVMAFMTLSAFFAAKLALGVVAAVGAHSLWRKADGGGISGAAPGSAPGGGDLNELASSLPQTATRRRIVKHPFHFF